MAFSFQNTIAYQTLSCFRQWKTLLLMLFFDALFVLSLFAFAKLFDTFFAAYEAALIGSWQGYLLLLAYFCLIVVAYSFFKYCQFDFLEQLEEGTPKKAKKTDFSLFGRFLLYNLITLFVLFGGFFALSTFFAISLIPFLKRIGIILVFLTFILFGYWFVQTSHVVFWKKKELLLQEIPKKTFALFDWKRFGGWLGWNLAFFLFFFLASLFVGMNLVIILFFVLISYFIILWNRIYLFVTITKAWKKNKEKEIHKL